VGQVKTLLSEEKYRIALHDFVATQAKDTVEVLGKIPVKGSSWSKDEFIDRIRRYEAAVEILIKLQILVGYWGGTANTNTLSLAPRRLAGDLKSEGGLLVWSGLRWYPVVLLLYASGIAALASRRYESLTRLLHGLVTDPD